MTASPGELVLTRVLDAASKEFEYLRAMFATLDSKAQLVVTTAGILLAGTLGFAKRELLDAALLQYGRAPLWLLGGTILTLVFTIACATSALWLTAVPSPLGIARNAQVAADFLDLDSETQTSRLSELYLDDIDVWVDIIATWDKVNGSKARRVMIAQAALAAAAFGAAAVFVLVLSAFPHVPTKTS